MSGGAASSNFTLVVSRTAGAGPWMPARYRSAIQTAGQAIQHVRADISDTLLTPVPVAQPIGPRPAADGPHRCGNRRSAISGVVTCRTRSITRDYS